MREIQKQRMMRYFIEAASQIVEEEGLGGVTVRKVADLAGYNSATLYNYFQNLDHLIFFASMRFLREYAQSLPRYVTGITNALERYFRVWETFCFYSYDKPEIYHAIFFAKLDIPLEESIKIYYELYPQDLGEQPEDLLPMLLKQDIYARARTILEACVKEGYIKEKDLVEVNEVVLLIYQGMLLRIINKQVDYSVDEAVQKTMKYIKKIIYAYR
ncbi:MAG: TetR family transcriptional regulator [Desulfitibacter sp. BRH_c19]|nr:MAG: TetR family transcriptional regulator [Desulfitibacter sp. BRH_c19]